MPVAAPTTGGSAFFNPTATFDYKTPCGATCTSDEFFEAFFGEQAGYTDSTSFAWQFHYSTPNDDAHGSWTDADYSTPSDPGNGDIHD